MITYQLYRLFFLTNENVQIGGNLFFILVNAPTCVVSFVKYSLIPNSEDRCESIAIFILSGAYLNSTQKVIFVFSLFQERFENL